MPNLDGQDYVILNSVANVSKIIDVLHGYGRIHCLLDNDEAGRKAYWELAREFSGRIRDFSDNYNGHKDLNDYLCGKPLSQSAEPMTEKKQVQSVRRMIQPPKNEGEDVEGNRLAAAWIFTSGKYRSLLGNLSEPHCMATLKIPQ